MKRILSLFTLIAMFLLVSCDSSLDHLGGEQQPSLSQGSSLPGMQVGTQNAEPDSVRLQEWERFREQHGENWNIRWDEKTGLPRTIRNGQTEPYRGSSEMAAHAFLTEYRNLFAMQGDLRDLRVEKTTENRYGLRRVTLRQYVSNIPVEGAQYKVQMDGDGRVIMANGYYYPGIEISTRASLSANQAISRSKNDLGVTDLSGESNTTELVIFPQRDIGSFALAWKTVIFAEEPFTDWLFYIDAHSGKVLEKYNRLTHVTGTGNVFPTHPGLSSVTSVNLYDLSGNGFLDGTFVEVFNASSARAHSSSHNFQYSTGSTHFDEVSLYYHVDNFRRNFINYLDGNNNLFTKLEATARENTICPSNACFSRATGNLYFSDTFEFAREDKIVHHEYGHAVIYDIESGIRSTVSEEGAISEGVPDYFAGAFTGRSQILDYAVPFAMRDMANPDINSFSQYTSEAPVPPHDGGEFFSSILWDIRNAPGISGSQSDFLVYDALHGISGTPNFVEFRDAMATAADAAYGSAHKNLVKDYFYFKGVGEYSLSPTVSGPGFVQVNATETWSSNVAGGLSPYSGHYWHKRESPMHPWLIVDTGPSYTETISSGANFQLGFCVTDSRSISRCSEPFQVFVQI